jgi:hypothetical protein
VFPHVAPDFVAATLVISRFSDADELAADSFASRIVPGTELLEITARPDLVRRDNRHIARHAQSDQ